MRWITAAAVLALATTIHADEIRGKVVSIADGDTITVLDADKVQHKIRLEGIDAPEKGQAFGTKSKEKMSELVGEKEVVVKWSKKDRYERILGDVYLGDRHINLEMVREGMAWHYKQYSKSKELAEAEDEARKAKKGLWADKSPEPPWEYRKREREKKAKDQVRLSPSLDSTHASTKIRSNCHFPASSELLTMQSAGIFPSRANRQTSVGVQPRSFETYSEPTVFRGICLKSSPEKVRSINAQFDTFGEAGLVGGGSIPAPGEISLAHNGVLFLDELPEFNRRTLEVLRQPLEDGVVTISRAMGSLTFPANLMLVSAMNPCPCGYRGDPRRQCHCNPMQIERYTGRISGPLLDRLDIHIEVPPVPFRELSDQSTGTTSATMKENVITAREIQQRRFGKSSLRLNGRMTPSQIRKFCKLESDAESLLKSAMEEMGLSARAHDKILRIGRTIADLDQSDKITSNHLSEAINYRTLDRSYWK
jgi:endonuclease YncB( thermonuclease family)